MFSRAIIILLALGAGVYRIATGAVLEGAGLLAMAAGLVCLQQGSKRPAMKYAAVACFAVTGAIIGYVLWRNTR